jgi:hypothetical protein
MHYIQECQKPPESLVRCGLLTVLLTLVTAIGCGSFTQYQTAEALGNAKWRASAGATVGVYKDKAQQSSTPGAVVSAAVSRGIGARLDVGLQVYSYGLEATTKVQVAGSIDTWSQAVALAIGGGTILQAAGQSRGLESHLRSAYLVSKRLRPSVAITGFASASQYFFLPQSGGSETGLWLGPGVNALWAFTESMEVMSELSVHAALRGSYPVDRSILQLGLSIATRW